MGVCIDFIESVSKLVFDLNNDESLIVLCKFSNYKLKLDFKLELNWDNSSKDEKILFELKRFFINAESDNIDHFIMNNFPQSYEEKLKTILENKNSGKIMKIKCYFFE